MEIINVFDTSIGTKNVGDEIIVDAVNSELYKMFNKETMFLKSPTHEKIGNHTHQIVESSTLSFVAGTNLLKSRYRLYGSNQWDITFKDASKFKNVILMGVGWGGYQSKPDYLSKKLYSKALTSNFVHSVRDSYTKEKLESIGIMNVVNTGCPTTWSLTEEHCKKMPTHKAKNVLTTITDYDKNQTRDKQMFDILLNNYDHVYCWIQGAKDLDYINQLSDKVILIAPNLKSFDEFLESNLDFDYVGTRLHAGIRAMQKGRRSVIIGIDNRAIEMNKDINMNVLNREEMDKLDEYINGEIETNIKLNLNGINSWKKQFIDLNN